MQSAMSIAAIGKQDIAKKYIGVGMTNQNIEQWKTKDASRAKHIALERLRSKLLTCIARYKTDP